MSFGFLFFQLHMFVECLWNAVNLTKTFILKDCWKHSRLEHLLNIRNTRLQYQQTITETVFIDFMYEDQSVIVTLLDQ